MRTKGNLAVILEERADEQFCMYCCKPRGTKDECCGESHFLPLRDFDFDTQWEIAEKLSNG